MKSILYTTIILLLPTVAHAEYRCMIESSTGRSQVRSMETFDSLIQAETTVKNYVVEKPQLINRTKNYSTVRRYDAFLICFDENGNVKLSEYYETVPDCEVGNFNGNFDCENFVIKEEEE